MPKGYGHQLIRLEQPRDELCGSWSHLTRLSLAFCNGATTRGDERISHICEWRYRRKGVEVRARRWLCRGCAIAWARAHIWTGRSQRRSPAA